MGMNTSHLRDDELIRHLDNTSTDPLIRRLVDIFTKNDDMIFQQLLKVGMDRDGLFETDYEYKPVGEYIEHLRSELAYYQTEAEELQYKLEDEKDRVKQLSARSIATVMEELKKEIKNLDWKVSVSNEDRMKAVKERDLAKEQLRAWNHLRNPA